MATRWKNTSEKWREINSRNRDLIMVLGAGAIAGGLFFFLINRRVFFFSFAEIFRSAADPCFSSIIS